MRMHASFEIFLVGIPMDLLHNFFFFNIVVIGGNESDRDSVHVCFVTLCVCGCSGIDWKAVLPKQTV